MPFVFIPKNFSSCRSRSYRSRFRDQPINYRHETIGSLYSLPEKQRRRLIISKQEVRRLMEIKKPPGK
ncbi:hypothetical protein HMPREF3150_02698 [Pseudomonas aeruginosa]|nr:hypothetical protein HMPREF3150_02698 [Pseudomonas aeruginosa]